LLEVETLRPAGEAGLFVLGYLEGFAAERILSSAWERSLGSRASMRAFCQAAISAAEKAILPRETRIGLGNRPSSIMVWSVERDLTPAAKRAAGSLTKWSSDRLIDGGFEGVMSALRYEQRAPMSHDSGRRGGTRDVQKARQIFP
jgi:hypothetical protein